MHKSGFLGKYSKAFNNVSTINRFKVAAPSSIFDFFNKDREKKLLSNDFGGDLEK